VPVIVRSGEQGAAAGSALIKIRMYAAGKARVLREIEQKCAPPEKFPVFGEH